MSNYSYQQWTATGSSSLFNLNLSGGSPLRIDHLRVYVNGELQARGVNYTVPQNLSSIQFLSGSIPTSGAKVVALRLTPSSASNRVVDFVPGSVLTSKDLDEATLNSLYFAQEVSDRNKLAFDPVTGVIDGDGVTITDVELDFGPVP